jgi:hypothetical protein
LNDKSAIASVSRAFSFRRECIEFVISRATAKVLLPVMRESLRHKAGNLVQIKLRELLLDGFRLAGTWRHLPMDPARARFFVRALLTFPMPAF